MDKIYHIISRWEPHTSWFVLADNSTSAIDTVIAMTDVSWEEAQTLYVIGVCIINDDSVCQIVGIHDS